MSGPATYVRLAGACFVLAREDALIPRSSPWRSAQSCSQIASAAPLLDFGFRRFPGN